MGIYDRDYYQDDQVTPWRPWDNRSMVNMIIIVNVILFVANFLLSARSGWFTYSLALSSDTLFHPLTWWRLVSYGFAHSPDGDIFHILFNMISLYFLGRGVEDRLGKWEFFRFYMIALVLCGIVWCGVHSGGAYLVGASGAVTAVSLLFVFFFPQAELRLYFAIPVKAWVLGVLIVAGNLFRPNTFGEQGSQVAYDVHLVGAAFAAAYFFSGFNFSFLSIGWQNFRQSAKIRSRGLKVHNPERGPSEKDEKNEQELDRILAKIHEDGEQSLTNKERKFMENYSRKIRKNRQ